MIASVVGKQLNATLTLIKQIVVDRRKKLSNRSEKNELFIDCKLIELNVKKLQDVLTQKAIKVSAVERGKRKKEASEGFFCLVSSFSVNFNNSKTKLRVIFIVFKYFFHFDHFLSKL